MATLTELLDAEARAYNISHGLKEEVAQCIGATWDEVASDTSLVRGFWIEAGSEVFTAWLVSEHVLGMHQRSLSGGTLTLTFPLARVRRVSMAGEADTLSMVIELDADQQVITLFPSENTALVRASGYEIRSVGDQRSAMRAFMRNLCRLL